MSIPKSIIAFDADGTLTQRNHYDILPRVLPEIIITLSEMNHFCIPLTGKPAAYAKRIIDTNKLIDCGIIAENAGVYKKPNSNTIEIYEKESVDAIYALKNLLGIETFGGGVRQIKLKDNSYEVVIDPEDISILTLFTDPRFVSHRWVFNRTISAEEVVMHLKDVISDNEWSDDLEVLDPFPDQGVQVIRKNRKTGKIIDKSSFPAVVKEIYGLTAIPPLAMFGDGHNDIPAMRPNEVIALSFSNAHPSVLEFIGKKGGYISHAPAPDGIGILEGLLWLSEKNFFQNDSAIIKEIIVTAIKSI